MRTTEFRLGNWMYDDDGSTFQIEKLEMGEVDHALCIPLSLAWIDDFGFEFSHRKPGTQGVYSNGKMKITLSNSGNFYRVNQLIPYVHNLQNIFHALYEGELLTKNQKTEQLNNAFKMMSKEVKIDGLSEEHPMCGVMFFPTTTKQKAEAIKEAENMNSIQPEQSAEGVLYEKGFKQGVIFRRTDAFDGDKGLGLFTGKFGSNCDGPTMLFEDGGTFLAEYCTPIKKRTAETIGFLVLEKERMIREMEKKLLLSSTIYSEFQ